VCCFLPSLFSGVPFVLLHLEFWNVCYFTIEIGVLFFLDIVACGAPHVCFWEEIMLLLSHPPHWQLVGLCSFNLFSAGIRICIFWFSQCSRTINFPFARDIGSYLSLIALISFVHICSHLFQFALIRSHVLSIVLFYFSFNYQILAYMQVWSDVRCRKRLLMLCAFLTTNALLSWRVNR